MKAPTPRRSRARLIPIKVSTRAFLSNDRAKEDDEAARDRPPIRSAATPPRRRLDTHADISAHGSSHAAPFASTHAARAKARRLASPVFGHVEQAGPLACQVTAMSCASPEQAAVRPRRVGAAVRSRLRARQRSY